MFALVLFICYLDGGCEDIVVDVYDNERQCTAAMDDQRIRHGGCFPVEDFIDSFWLPRSTVTFSPSSVAPPGLTPRQIPPRYQYSADYRSRNAV